MLLLYTNMYLCIHVNYKNGDPHCKKNVKELLKICKSRYSESIVENVMALV